MAASFHEMTDEELSKQLESAASEIRELRFNYAVARSLQDPARVGKLRKDVARIKTVKRARELGIAKQVEKAPAKTKAKAKAPAKGKSKSK